MRASHPQCSVGHGWSGIMMDTAWWRCTWALPPEGSTRQSQVWQVVARVQEQAAMHCWEREPGGRGRTRCDTWVEAEDTGVNSVIGHWTIHTSSSTIGRTSTWAWAIEEWTFYLHCHTTFILQQWKWLPSIPRNSSNGRAWWYANVHWGLIWRGFS